ncbi:MAG TPA: hypothetical protein VMY99_04390 [Nevskiaceae bacterium]|nr:hypothetical protein [Nevskiaceae bacterium]
MISRNERVRRSVAAAALCAGALSVGACGDTAPNPGPKPAIITLDCEHNPKDAQGLNELNDSRYHGSRLGFRTTHTKYSAKTGATVTYSPSKIFTLLVGNAKRPASAPHPFNMSKYRAGDVIGRFGTANEASVVAGRWDNQRHLWHDSESHATALCGTPLPGRMQEASANMGHLDEQISPTNWQTVAAHTTRLQTVSLPKAI